MSFVGVRKKEALIASHLVMKENGINAALNVCYIGVTTNAAA